MMDKNKHRRKKKALSVALEMHIFTGKTPPFKARGVILIDDGSAVCAVQYRGDGDWAMSYDTHLISPWNMAG